ncbi:MAG: ABC transporter substrate-binding protein, partial [Solirubrobacteraceae bacterium]
VVLKPFAKYYGGRSAVGGLQFDTFAAATSLVSGLQSGQIQGAVITDFADLKSLSKSRKFRITTARTAVWDVMVNCGKPPFNNVLVRRALSYSLNRSQIAKAAFFGFEIPTCTPFYNPASPAYSANLVKAQPFDLAKAKRILSGAGAGSLSTTLSYPSAYPTVQTLAEIWQADLQQIGVTLQLQPLASPAWEAMITNPDAGLVMWNNGRIAIDPAVFWATQTNQLSGNALAMGWSEPSQAPLIALAAHEVNPGARKTLYQHLSQLVVNSAHCIAVVSDTSTWAWSAKAPGASADAVGNLQLGGVSLT